MRIILLTALTIFGLHANAQSFSCDDTLKLTCTAGFQNKETRVFSYETKSAKYVVQNAEDLAEAYCEAVVSFKKDDLYVHGTLSHTRMVSVGIVKNAKDGKSMDLYSSRTDLGLGRKLNMYSSVSPYEASSAIASVNLECELVRE